MDWRKGLNAIHTATATNDGFHMHLAVAATDRDAARTAILRSGILKAPSDEGGDYVLDDEIREIPVDEDGRVDLGHPTWIGDPASMLANPGTVEMLSSGANG